LYVCRPSEHGLLLSACLLLFFFLHTYISICSYLVKTDTASSIPFNFALAVSSSSTRLEDGCQSSNPPNPHETRELSSPKRNGTTMKRFENQVGETKAVRAPEIRALACAPPFNAPQKPNIGGWKYLIIDLHNDHDTRYSICFAKSVPVDFEKQTR